MDTSILCPKCVVTEVNVRLREEFDQIDNVLADSVPDIVTSMRTLRYKDTADLRNPAHFAVTDPVVNTFDKLQTDAKEAQEYIWTTAKMLSLDVEMKIREAAGVQLTQAHEDDIAQAKSLVAAQGEIVVDTMIVLLDEAKETLLGKVEEAMVDMGL